MPRIDAIIWRISLGFHDPDIYLTNVVFLKEKIIKVCGLLTSCCQSCNNAVFVSVIIYNMPNRNGITICSQILHGVCLQFILAEPRKLWILIPFGFPDGSQEEWPRKPLSSCTSTCSMSERSSFTGSRSAACLTYGIASGSSKKAKPNTAPSRIRAERELRLRSSSHNRQ